MSTNERLAFHPRDLISARRLKVPKAFDCERVRDVNYSVCQFDFHFQTKFYFVMMSHCRRHVVSPSCAFIQ